MIRVERQGVDMDQPEHSGVGEPTPEIEEEHRKELSLQLKEKLLEVTRSLADEYLQSHTFNPWNLDDVETLARTYAQSSMPLRYQEATQPFIAQMNEVGVWNWQQENRFLEPALYQELLGRSIARLAVQEGLIQSDDVPFLQALLEGRRFHLCEDTGPSARAMDEARIATLTASPHYNALDRLVSVGYALGHSVISHQVADYGPFTEKDVLRFWSELEGLYGPDPDVPWKVQSVYHKGFRHVLEGQELTESQRIQLPAVLLERLEQVAKDPRHHKNLDGYEGRDDSLIRIQNSLANSFPSTALSERLNDKSAFGSFHSGFRFGVEKLSRYFR